MTKRLVWVVVIAFVAGWAWIFWKRLHPTGLQFADVSKKDPYEAVARATGGGVIRLDKSHVNAGALTAQMLALMNEQDDATLISAEGVVDPAGASFDFLVDPSIDVFSCVVSGLKTRPDAEFRDPKNKIVSSDESLPSNAAQRFVFHKPAPGRWSVHVHAPSGENLRVVIKAKTSVIVSSVRVVRPGGRPGHEGLFPYEGPLKPKADALLESRIDGGKLKNVTVRLLSLDGHELRKERVHQERPEAASVAWAGLHGASTQGGSDDFVVRIHIPAQPFRVQIDGENQAGDQVSRLYERPFLLGKLALREFRSPKLAETTENCAFLSRLGIFSDQDPNNPASAMLTCVREVENGHETLTSSLSLTLPLAEDGAARTVTLRTPEYHKLSAAECDQTKQLLERHPSVLSHGSESPNARWTFRCSGGPSTFTGELEVSVSRG